MVTVAKDDVLARVAADLAEGHTYPALRRLASYAAAYPDDLDVRVLRGQINRQIGNLAEAGRWTFLTEEPRPEELAAFTRGYPYPLARLRALNLRGDPSGRLGPVARGRLADLREQVNQAGAAPVGRQPPNPHLGAAPTWGDRIGCVLAGLLGCIPLALMVIGLVTVLRWLG